MVNLTIMSMIFSMCGGEDDSTSSQIDEVTTKSSTTTSALSKVEVFNEDELVVPPILLKPLIGATGILLDATSDWEVLSSVTNLDTGIKVRTAENATAQMSFDDGSSLLMGGNSLINIRSYKYDSELKSRVLIVDVISGSIAYDIFSDGLDASIAKIITPTAELSVHGTEGVFEYDVSTLSAKSTVLVGGEKSDDAVFSELLPDEKGNPVMVAVSQTAGTELGSSTTGGSGWIDEDPGKIALIVDDFVSTMEGECSYTCKAETQEKVSDGTKTMSPGTVTDAIFTDADTTRLSLTSNLLTAAGAPASITDSVDDLNNAVAEVAVTEASVQEFIDDTWDTAPGADGVFQDLPPIELSGTFGDAADVFNNEEFSNLGFDYEGQQGFRAQHGMMQFISTDTAAVNELAATGNVSNAMALAASNILVNASSDTGEFVEGTFCYDNPDDFSCLGGPVDPGFITNIFAGNGFIEDMVQDMGFNYSFTDSDIKPAYCEENPKLAECLSTPTFTENSPLSFISDNLSTDTFCGDNPDDPTCLKGNIASVYTFFHVYDDEILGDDFIPVDCAIYSEDPMCTGSGDFFQDYVADVNAVALDRNDMIDIFGAPIGNLVEGAPPEYCANDPEAPECSDDFNPAQIYESGEYQSPDYCEEYPGISECAEDFYNPTSPAFLSGALLATYAAPDESFVENSEPGFCVNYPDHPECSRDYYAIDESLNQDFLGKAFSNAAFVDISQQNVYFSSIESADVLSESKYGNHNDYLISNPLGEDIAPGSDDFSPELASLFVGDENTEIENNYTEGDLIDLCEGNATDPLCYSSNNEESDFLFDLPDTNVGPDSNNPPPPSNFWGSEEAQNQFEFQQDSYEDFADDFCSNNPTDPTCLISSEPGGITPPPGGEEVPPGGEEVPPGGEEVPPAPGPAPGPDPGPAPGPAPGPDPGPDPGPAPGPDPDPGPAPGPDPGPAPGPDPGPDPPP